jgi:type VI secretion system secreted protein Hcp
MRQGLRLGRGLRIGVAVAAAAGLIAAAVAAVPAAAAPAASGPVRWSMEIKDSTSKTPAQDIEIESWSWGAANPVSLGSAGSGAGSGKVAFQPFSITRQIDASSPQLFSDVASGKHLTEVDVVGVRQGPQGAATPFMTLALKDVLVTSIDWSAGNGGDQPKEELTLAFARVQVTAGDTTSTTNPPSTASWDLTTNTSQ